MEASPSAAPAALPLAAGALDRAVAGGAGAPAGGEPEAALDLQYVFTEAYDRGPYLRGEVDYGGPPAVAVPAELTPWLEDCLRAAGLRPAEGGRVAPGP